MEKRILLKEIPAQKFHSGIFTTFAINLYYLEQQVLPLLGGKGIHYVSILCDSSMLSSQLQNYGLLSQQRKRSYAINGMECAGAFHPKMIFLAGAGSLLLLLGSGNLTTSGHGINLEVWNAIYVENTQDKLYGFVIQAWNYLKGLHADLGDLAQNKLKSIEENCFLLSNTIIPNVSSFDIDPETKMSFCANNLNNSLFKQISDTIGTEEIKRITIMSPFYDSEGQFIKELNNRYNPKEINVLIQKNFGSLPYLMNPLKNIRFYDWEHVMHDELRQKYFHAKNIVIEGKTRRYLISGSANATIAAFGTLKTQSVNQESCVLYQSNKTDFLTLLGIKFTNSPVTLKDYKSDNFILELVNEASQTRVFIRTSERNNDTVVVLARSKNDIPHALLKLFSQSGKVVYEQALSIVKGDNTIKLSIPNGISLFYSEIYIKTKSASNKQFIIDNKAFEGTNPSPRNRSLNHIRKLIENGDFSTAQIIDYLNTIYRQKENRKRTLSGSNKGDLKNELPKEDESDLIYMSYSEIQERAGSINEFQNAAYYLEYRGVRLWESIFSYLKESREKENQTKIDEEETEDINKSTGRRSNEKNKKPQSISEGNYDRLKDKVKKFLDDYWNVLSNKINDGDCEKPSIIDLAMYLIVIEILLLLVSHKEKIKEEEEERSLLEIPFSMEVESWSAYLLEFVGMFLVWCTKKVGFKEVEGKDYQSKLEQYKKLAFQTNLSALAIFYSSNKICDNEKIKKWLQLSLLNTSLVFNVSNEKHADVEEFLTFIPHEVIKEYGEGILVDSINENLGFLHNHKYDKKNIKEGDIFYHPEIGFAIVNKIIANTKNTFYKLFSPGFEWSETVGDYWNGYLYSITEKRWLKSTNA